MINYSSIPFEEGQGYSRKNLVFLQIVFNKTNKEFAEILNIQSIHVFDHMKKGKTRITLRTVEALQEFCEKHSIKRVFTLREFLRKDFSADDFVKEMGINKKAINLHPKNTYNKKVINDKELPPTRKWQKISVAVAITIALIMIGLTIYFNTQN